MLFYPRGDDCGAVSMPNFTLESWEREFYYSENRFITVSA